MPVRSKYESVGIGVGVPEGINMKGEVWRLGGRYQAVAHRLGVNQVSSEEDEKATSTQIGT
jgi:hypothetical protein